MNSRWRDLRYGARMLRTQPSLPLLAVLTTAASLQYDDLAAQHVHPAGEFEFAGFRWRELDGYGLIEREFAFNVVIRQDDFSTAARFDFAHERYARGNALPQFEAIRLVALLIQCNGHGLYLLLRGSRRFCGRRFGRRLLRNRFRSRLRR